ncbi:hypothetical protein [Cellulomonas endophytica]|uniref:hypothetical protein n=1 Tax=Cellulomonas endophytica TaxID=2494735 RepID=UPI001012D9E7|nr:hypothetical protein [Cellulomonas endophytica]
MANALMPRFGSEDPVRGGDSPPDADPATAHGWYHQLITLEAAKATGWDVGGRSPRPAESSAAAGLAWYADFLDSYLYHPFWWAAGGQDRFFSAVMARPALLRLHFDDLHATWRVREVFQRVLAGTVAALVWAAERDRVESARLAVGAGLHAIQDFYSHSTWLDDSDRTSTLINALPTSALQTPKNDKPATWVDLHAFVLGAEPSTSQWDLGSVNRRRRALHRRLAAAPLDLFTGSYESQPHLGQKEHGSIGFDCLVYDLLPDWLFDLLTALPTPLANSTMTRRWDICRQEGRNPGVTWDSPVPPSVGYYLPGINLDSRWQAAYGVRERGIHTRTTGDEAFDLARRLAVRHSQQWLEELNKLAPTLDSLAAEHGHPADFWHRVRTQPRGELFTPPAWTSTAGDVIAALAGGAASEEHEYEAPHLQVFRFLTAGPDPAGSYDQSGTWYLRLQITTADVSLAGTDAQVWAWVDGAQEAKVLLDHRTEPGQPASGLENIITEYNDFAAGARTAYVIGPFDRRPEHLTLAVESTNVLDVIGALLEGMVTAIGAIVSQVIDLIRSLYGADANPIGQDTKSWNWKQLSAMAQAPARETPPWVATWTFDGTQFQEGRFALDGRLAVTALPGGDLEVTVHLYRLHCRSLSPEWSASDEPFVVGVVDAPGTRAAPDGTQDPRITWMFGPFSVATDGGPDGDGSYPIIDRQTIRIPRGSGLIIALQMWESDQESHARRRRIRDEFASLYGTGTQTSRNEIATALGGWLASDWRPQRVEVFAFNRVRQLEAGTVADVQVTRWVEDDAPLEILLDSRLALGRTEAARPAVVIPHIVDSW